MSVRNQDAVLKTPIMNMQNEEKKKVARASIAYEPFQVLLVVCKMWLAYVCKMAQSLRWRVAVLKATQPSPPRHAQQSRLEPSDEP
jgi:hypothetical protein